MFPVALAGMFPLPMITEAGNGLNDFGKIRLYLDERRLLLA